MIPSHTSIGLFNNQQWVWPLRWTLYYGMAAAILFFAAFGQSAFIYQQY